jgi:hypothetical protein
MVLPMVDDHHKDIRQIVQKISLICLSDEFLLLKKELESLYQRSGSEHASVLAFQDALYSMIAQEEIDVGRLRVY